jgi:hypothetical protein
MTGETPQPTGRIGGLSVPVTRVLYHHSPDARRTGTVVPVAPKTASFRRRLRACAGDDISRAGRVRVA